MRQLLTKGYEVKCLILPDDPYASRLEGLEAPNRGVRSLAKAGGMFCEHVAPT